MNKAVAVTVALLGASSPGVSATAADTTCRPIKEIYASGKELCEKTWNGAFKYETDEAAGYSMWFFDAENPNDAISQSKGLLADGTQPDECKVQYFHKSAPGPEPAGFTECHPWKDHACCNSDVVESYIHLKEGYGTEYHWDRCGPLSQECERFYVQEACFYECEPNVGYWKKYPNGTHPDANDWEMSAMPIKASYCDAFYTACADDLFCGDGDFFACAAVYSEQDAAAASSDSDDDMSGGVVVAIIVGGILLVCACGTIAFFIVRERSGKPVFAPLMGKQAPAGGGQSIGNSG